MANPRQRKKSRAGNTGKPTGQALRRLHQKQVKVPTLRGPEVLQKKWDKKLTVKQNYEALGLLSNIPLPVKPSTASSHQSSSDITTSLAPIGFGRIIRDAEGNVIDVILPDEDEEEADEQEEVGEKGLSAEEKGKGREAVEAKTDVARSLEQISALSAPIKRHSSTSEQVWLLQLLSLHGHDTSAMARDRKLNVWQKTEGELKRMIRKAGGWEGLEKIREREGGMNVD